MFLKLFTTLYATGCLQIPRNDVTSVCIFHFYTTDLCLTSIKLCSWCMSNSYVGNMSPTVAMIVFGFAILTEPLHAGLSDWIVDYLEMSELANIPPTCRTGYVYYDYGWKCISSIEALDNVHKEPIIVRSRPKFEYFWTRPRSGAFVHKMTESSSRSICQSRWIYDKARDKCMPKLYLLP